MRFRAHSASFSGFLYKLRSTDYALLGSHVVDLRSRAVEAAVGCRNIVIGRPCAIGTLGACNGSVVNIGTQGAVADRFQLSPKMVARTGRAAANGFVSITEATQRVGRNRGNKTSADEFRAPRCRRVARVITVGIIVDFERELNLLD